MGRLAAVLLLVLAGGCGDHEDAGKLAFYDFKRDLDPAPTGEIRCDSGVPCPEIPRARRFTARRDAAVTADDVAEARATSDPATGASVVLLSLTEQGQQSFRDLTRAVARRGIRTGRPEHVAIVVDGIIVSVAIVDPAADPDGMSAESGVQINGLPPERARAVADELDG